MDFVNRELKAYTPEFRGELDYYGLESELRTIELHQVRPEN